MSTLSLEHVSKWYLGASSLQALDDVTFDVDQGEFIAIVGPSGSGKSTLLNIIGLLDTPTSGRYVLHGANVVDFSAAELARHRSGNIAFIFQGFHLLDRRAVIDSVELGLLYQGVRRRDRVRRAVEALSRVGLVQKTWQVANTLSGGERQRVAIARALATGADLIVADEPTGNLDSKSAESVVNELRALNREGKTIVVVTHSQLVAAQADRRIRIVDGKTVSDENTGSNGITRYSFTSLQSELDKADLGAQVMCACEQVGGRRPSMSLMSCAMRWRMCDRCVVVRLAISLRLAWQWHSP